MVNEGARERREREKLKQNIGLKRHYLSLMSYGIEFKASIVR